jgi:hypothetical protein
MALRAFPNDDSMHALARYLLASAVLQLLFLAHFGSARVMSMGHVITILMIAHGRLLTPGRGARHYDILSWSRWSSVSFHCSDSALARDRRITLQSAA